MLESTRQELTVYRQQDAPVYQTSSRFSEKTTMPPEGSTKAWIPPSCPSLDSRSRDAEAGFEPRTFRLANSRSNQKFNVEFNGTDVVIYPTTRQQININSIFKIKDPNTCRKLHTIVASA
ncbi:hypothetical protein T265_03286 [Opisthorchis viverrini]|uniref:Uncharacterized protein n=1 Tax=Opisthorchis viverrini TaxID=6198 RepID=A0A074ZWG6_OPIVI|nr:hypothetical protein T265_03286 [Opisthorchis viverrini]KER30227.1 hypothetical protein T265_03286 [Opisthorchis viverrini]